MSLAASSIRAQIRMKWMWYGVVVWVFFMMGVRVGFYFWSMGADSGGIFLGVVVALLFGPFVFALVSFGLWAALPGVG